MAQAVPRIANSLQSPIYGWVVILTWMAIHMWGYLVMETLGLFLPSMREELNLTPVREGLLGAAPQLTVLILSIPFGLYLSRFPPKLLTLVSIVAAICVIFFQAWAPVYGLVLLARLLYGLSITLREPARTLLLRMWIRPRQILIANASIELLWGIGAALFILIPVILKALDDDWRKTMQVLGYATIALAVVWFVVGRERPMPDAETERESKEPVSIRSALRYKELWLLAIGLVGVEMTFSSFATFWPSHMKDTYGIDIQTSALIWAIGGMVAGPSGLGINLMVNKTGKRRTALRVGGALISVTTVALLYSGSFPVLVVLSLLHGLSFTFFPVIFTIPFQLKGIRTREIAVAMGFLRTALMVGAMSGPIAAGVLHEISDDRRLSPDHRGYGRSNTDHRGLLPPRRMGPPPPRSGLTGSWVSKSAPSTPRPSSSRTSAPSPRSSACTVGPL